MSSRFWTSSPPLAFRHVDPWWVLCREVSLIDSLSSATPHEGCWDKLSRIHALSRQEEFSRRLIYAEDVDLSEGEWS